MSGSEATVQQSPDVSVLFVARAAYQCIGGCVWYLRCTSCASALCPIARTLSVWKQRKQHTCDDRNVVRVLLAHLLTLENNSLEARGRQWHCCGKPGNGTRVILDRGCVVSMLELISGRAAVGGEPRAPASLALVGCWLQVSSDRQARGRVRRAKRLQPPEARTWNKKRSRRARK